MSLKKNQTLESPHRILGFRVYFFFWEHALWPCELAHANVHNRNPGRTENLVPFRIVFSRIIWFFSCSQCAPIKFPKSSRTYQSLPKIFPKFLICSPTCSHVPNAFPIHLGMPSQWEGQHVGLLKTEFVTLSGWVDTQRMKFKGGLGFRV